MDTIPFRRPATRPALCLISTLNGVTAITRCWPEGHLEADPACSVCPSRLTQGCLTQTTEILSDAAYETYDRCKALALRSASGTG